MGDQHGKVPSFGPFELSIGNRLLTDGAKVVPLGARAMDLLIVLVEQANKVVGRRTLIERVIRTNFGNQLRLYGRGKTSCRGNKDRGIRNWLLRSVYLTA
jgi:DNA-binding response OmpR family regulator